jgi:glycosyltransferase involved in cell wall biosynthesis
MNIASPPRREDPLVSVIVRTCAGRRGLLAECLASIDAQQYRNVEIVVVEDGSDEAAETVAALAARTDLRVVYRAVAKSGRSRAGNAGLERASGELLNFLDDDDQLFPNHVRVLVEALRARPDAAAARARSLEVPTVFDSLDPLAYREVERRPFRAPPFSRAALWQRNFAPIQAVLFRRELYERHGGFHPGLDRLEDWNLWMRYFTSAEVVCADETTSLFRVPGDAGSRRLREQDFAPFLPLVEAGRREIPVTLSVAEVFEISREIWRHQYPGLWLAARGIEWLKAGRVRRFLVRAAWRCLRGSAEMARAAARRLRSAPVRSPSPKEIPQRWMAGGCSTCSTTAR